VQPTQDFVTLSRQVGSPDADLVILAEGNTSTRADAASFWVKASGQSLHEITERGFVQVAFEPIVAALQQDLQDAEVKALLESASLVKNGARPSVETFMHAWLLQLTDVNVVIHTHPTDCLGDLCQTTPPCWIEERIFPDEIVCCGRKTVWVPYEDPGLVLAKRIAECVTAFMSEEGEVPKVIALQNHGLITLGTTGAQAMAATRMTVKAVRARHQTVGITKPLTSQEIDRIHVRPDEHYRQRMLWGASGFLASPNEGSRSGQDQQ
jgi:rhamnose utilization protein RhaD (predicted bifunctional aldolase and dehydrogenase)